MTSQNFPLFGSTKSYENNALVLSKQQYLKIQIGEHVMYFKTDVFWVMIDEDSTYIFNAYVKYSFWSNIELGSGRPGV